MNLYEMVGSDPVNYVDILGLEAVDYQIPDKLKTCCDKKTIEEGERKLREKFAEVVAKLKSMGAKPVDPGQPGFSCKNSSSDILSFLTPAPKCWNCRTELRKDKELPGDHQVVVCRSYGKDASPSKELLFDWWGDNYGLNYKGDVQKFRESYPVFVDSPPNPYFTDCDGKPYSYTGRFPTPGFWATTGHK